MRDHSPPGGPGPISQHESTSGAPARAATLPRQTCRRLTGVAIALAATALAIAAGADASVPHGDPAARLPQGALAGESWDLVARFDSGHVLVASIGLTNTGLGGRTAVVVGDIVEPDGTSHRFSRSEREGGWRLDHEGRRLDLQSIVLDQARATRRFVVDKNELGIELAIDSTGRAAWPGEEATPGCGFDVLEVAGPAHGSFRRSSDAPPIPLRGLAAITHRWTPGLEVDCLHHAVELFAMQPGLGLYFRESETAAGERHSWLLVRRDGRTVFEGAPSESEVSWRTGAPGYPEPAQVRFTAPGLAGRVEFGEPLGVFEPLARLPAPLRAAIELRTRPRLVWSAPRFELQLGRRALHGGALAKLAWTNPQAAPAGGEAAADAARGGE